MKNTVAILSSLVPILAGAAGLPLEAAPLAHAQETRVVVESDGWELVGDLRIPPAGEPVPAVLLLNQAAADRTDYVGLAERLAERGLASLRLDLRGHGESINLGVFEPGRVERDPIIWDAEADVSAALSFLAARPELDADRLAVVGGSYSGEEMAEAGRLDGYARAYVALSPGSFSDESIAGIDTSGVSWLLVVSNDERYLEEISTAVLATSRTAEVVVLPGTAHATRILSAHPGIEERIAVWLAHHLGRPDAP